MLAKKLMSGAASRVVNTTASILISFIMTPFILHHLGDSAYGLWLLVAAITSFYGMMDFGLAAATQRSIAQALAKQDDDNANAAVVTSFGVFCIISLIVTVCAAVMIFFGDLIVKDVSRLDEFRLVAVFLTISFVLLFPTYAVSGIYSANFRYDISSRIHLVRLLARFGLIYVFVKMGGGLITMAVITTITDVLAGVAMMVIAHRLAPWLKWKRKYFQSGRVKELFSFGGALFFVTLCERGRNSLPSFAMNASSGLSAVTLFGVAQQIYDYFVQFMANIFGVFQPLFIRQQSSDDHRGNEEDFIFITRLALIVAMALAVGAIAAAPDFIEVWLGTHYKRALGPMFILLLIGVFYSGLQLITQLMLAYSRQKALAVLSMLEVLVTAALLFPMIKWLEFEGLALAVLVPAVVSRLFVQPFILRKSIQIDMAKYFSVIVRCALLLSGSVWLISELRGVMPGHGYLKAVLMALASVAIVLPCSYLVCLDKASRSRIHIATKKALTPYRASR